MGVTSLKGGSGVGNTSQVRNSTQVTTGAYLPATRRPCWWVEIIEDDL